MEGYMRKRSLLLLTGALVLVASLVVGPSATAKPKAASAGTVVIIHDQEPGILNPFLSEGNGYTVSLALNKILAAGLIYNNKVQLVPELLQARPKILKKEPLTATATYKPTAVWSDGRQITGADFIATWRTIMNPNWDIVSREGWEDIASVTAKGKSFTVRFKPKRAFYDWEGIMGNRVLPAHKVAGQDFNKLWSDSLDIASGPFKFGSWQRARSSRS
jgi:peptide/nickel transport system substrate-binding protein